jgi:hypothetical protein
MAGLSIKHTYIVFYVVLLAFAHGYGYWSTFHVNLLEHIGLADLPKLAVWPIVATAGAYLVGPVVTMLIGSRHLPPGGGATTRAGIFLNRHRKLIGTLLIAGGLALSAVEVVSEYLWILCPLLFANGFWIAIDIEGFLKRINIDLRYPFDLLCVLLPCLALSVGYSESLKIKNGHEYLDARFENSGPSLRYLGRAGDFVFFWNSCDLDTEIRKLDSIQPLNLRYVRHTKSLADPTHPCE